MSTPSLRVSPTQRRLSHTDLDALVRRALGAGIGVAQCAEFTGGYFAAVWRCDLTDGRSVVVKVGPPAGVPILTYELDAIAAEAEYFRLVGRLGDVPVPNVLAAGRDDAGGDWLITALLPGTPLAELRDKITDAEDAGVRRALGTAVARVHTVTGTEFGYPGGRRAHAATWRAAYRGFMDELLADASRLGAELPVPPDTLNTVIDRHAHVLDAVRRPALLHFDLWDGNVLVDRDPAGRPTVTGLVDGERYLYGDPLLDLVSPAIFRRIEDEPDHPFLAGYADGAGAPVTLDEPARIRLGLYRLHLYLVMNVEPVVRGMGGPEHAEHRRSLADLLIGEVTSLEQEGLRP